MKKTALTNNRNLILIMFLSCIINNLMFSQNLQENIIYKIDFSEENQRKIIVKKNKKDFVFQKFNKKNHDIQTCKWEVILNKNKIEKLIIEIEKILTNKKYKSDNHLFNINQNKKNIKLLFKNSNCISEHKLYYLQKDCNRKFIVKLKERELKNLLSNLKRTIDASVY